MKKKFSLEWVARKGDTFVHYSRMYNTREEYLDALEQLAKDNSVIRISGDGMGSLRHWPFC